MFNRRIQDTFGIRRDDSGPKQHRRLNRPFRTFYDRIAHSSAYRNDHRRWRYDALIRCHLSRRLPPVDPHAGRLLMLVQIRLQSKRFSTPTTDVRLGVGMRLDVRSQIRLVRERFVADGALERLLA